MQRRDIQTYPKEGGPQPVRGYGSGARTSNASGSDSDSGWPEYWSRKDRNQQYIVHNQMYRLHKVLCEENFRFEDVRHGPIQMTQGKELSLPAGSTIDPTQTETIVTFQSCTVDVVPKESIKLFQATFEVLIAQKMVFNRPGISPLHLEFSSVKTYSQILRTCKPVEVCPADLKHIQCRVWDFDVNDTLTFYQDMGTFEDYLVIEGTLRVETDVQIPLLAKTPTKPVEVIELDILIGKLKNMMPTGIFKAEILSNMIQVTRLLKEGLVLEALAVLTVILEQLNYHSTTSGARAIGVQQIVRDLLCVKQILLHQNEWM